ncbi:MAG: response regulator transcription factor [Lachnospiraceae bacterium]|nr:response regulator transcription factor [Lachnospiraceae bacterium]MDY3274516.1 response regulator transcription factor [Agathobacter sp.]MDY5103246.1 response regulator transcription factor [Agathobacter sp.]
MIRILIVEDEEPIANLIRINLKNAGYVCDVANTGTKGADLLQENVYDLCLLDIMLPEIDGYELLEYAKTLGTPVIFLTAKGETLDKVRGLRLGAEDYITKPFEILELLARVDTVLRRYHKAEQQIHACGLLIDIPSRTVTKAGKVVELTYKEFDLLLLFVRNPNVALYREMIYERVWESPYMGDSRTVDLHVQRLRKKAGLEKQIEAVYKVGYRFRDETSEQAE